MNGIIKEIISTVVKSPITVALKSCKNTSIHISQKTTTKEFEINIASKSPPIIGIVCICQQEDQNDHNKEGERDGTNTVLYVIAITSLHLFSNKILRFNFLFFFLLFFPLFFLHHYSVLLSTHITSIPDNLQQLIGQLLSRLPKGK